MTGVFLYDTNNKYAKKIDNNNNNIRTIFFRILKFSINIMGYIVAHISKDFKN
jgi:hypothetical protein